MVANPDSSSGDDAVLDSAVARRAWQLTLLERDVLAVLAQHQPVARALDLLARGLERIAAPGTLASILTVDAHGVLRHGAAPSIPATYTARIDGEAIGENQGSCGTAAFRRAPVVVTDIASDALWAEYRELALAHGLKSCWSVPIVAYRGDVLGTFAFYHREPRAPTAEDFAAIEGAARLARIVLEHARAERDRTLASRREKALFAAACVLAESDVVAQAMHGVIEAVATALEWDAAAVWLLGEGRAELSCVCHWSKPGAPMAEFIQDSCSRTLGLGQGLPGRVCASGESEWLEIRVDDPHFARARAAVAAGLSDGFALPIVSGREVVGAIELFTTNAERSDPELLRALLTIGLQVGQFLRRAEAQAEQERLVGDLRETVRFGELFSGVLAHDLRNPLSTLVMGTELLLGDATDPRGRITLTRMQNSGRRMTRMIEQLLDLTRSRSAGGLAVTRTSMDLGELAESVVNELSLAFPERRIEVERRGDTRGAWDPDRLAQVISNLVGNAVQHGAAEGVVTVMVDGSNPARIELRTHNFGAIPAAYLPSLFDPFRRAGAATTRQQSQGLGLGLYITKLIADAHDGSVTVDSGAGGTTFQVVLPR